MRRTAFPTGPCLLLAACGVPDLSPGETSALAATLDASVVINEFSPGSSGWVELFNTTDAPVDVSGWTVDDVLGGGAAPKLLPAGATVPAGGYLVVSYSGINTASADTVNLLDSAGALVDSRGNGHAGTSLAGLCFGRQPDGGAWAAGAIPCSRGASNGGATPPAPALVVINEFQAGSAGWVELFNLGSVAADLTGWSVDDVAGGGSSPKVVGSGVVIPPRGLVVVSYGGVNTASSDAVRLVDGAGVTVDSHGNFHAGSSIAGLCFGRVPDGAEWAATSIPCSRGTANSAVTPPPPAHVVINEFHPGSSGWVELFNAGEGVVDLTGWKVDDVAGGGASPRNIPAGTTLAPGQVALVGFTGINTASADDVRLLDPTGAVVDARGTYFGTDPCYGAGKCYGRLPNGGAWAPAHIPCSGAANNPDTAPDPCAPGQGCDDGNACTSGDTCSASCVCTAGPVLACDDQNPCTTDACWPATGCANTPAPDGTACPGALTCQGGVCGGSEPTPCVATGGTYKSVAFTRSEECQAVLFLNKARYSQMGAITTTARDIAYDCSPGGTCGYRSAAWSTVAQYAAARGTASTLTVGTASLAALKTASAGYNDDGLWYDTVAHTSANKEALNNAWVHFESVLAEERSGLCLIIRDLAGAPNFLAACMDPWHFGHDGVPADYLEPQVGKWLSLRGRLTNETGSWKVVIKSFRTANPAVR